MKTSQHTWSSNAYKLSSFIKRFPLPQTVKVEEGVLNEENEQESCCTDDVLILHREETSLQVSVSNTKKEVKTLPLTTSTKALRINPEFAHSRLNSRDILKQLSKVLFLMVIDEDNETDLKRDEKFRIRYHSVQNHGKSFSFVLESTKDSSRVISITENCKAHFKPIIDHKEHFISEIVRKFGLPQFVLAQNSVCEFPNEDDRVLKLERTFTEFEIIVSNTIEPDWFFSLKRDSELSIYPTLEAELLQQNALSILNDNSSIEKMQRDKNVVLYEDMSCPDPSLLTAIDSQGLDVIKADRVEARCINRYVPTPSAKAMKTFFGHLMVPNDSYSRSVYSFPKMILEEQIIEYGGVDETSNHVPRNGTNFHCLKGATSRDAVTTESAQGLTLDNLQKNNNESLYEEISFRELIGENPVKGRKRFTLNCVRRKSEGQVDNNRQSVALKSRKWTSFKQSKSSERKTGIQIEPGSSTAIVRSQNIQKREIDDSKLCNEVSKSDKRRNDQKRSHDQYTSIGPKSIPNQQSTDKQEILSCGERTPDQKRPNDRSRNRTINSQRTFDRKKDRTDLHFGKESVIYTLRSTKPSLFDSDSSTSKSSHHERTSPLQYRSHSVGCLNECLPEESVSKSLAKKRLFASKSVKMDVRPPLPPPRTSSIRPEESSSPVLHREDFLSRRNQSRPHDSETACQSLGVKLSSHTSKQKKISSVYRECISHVRDQLDPVNYSRQDTARIHKSEIVGHAQDQHSLPGLTKPFRKTSPVNDELNEQRLHSSGEDSLYEEITKPFVDGSDQNNTSRGRSGSALQVVNAALADTDKRERKPEDGKAQIEEMMQTLMTRQGHHSRSKTEIGFEVSKVLQSLKPTVKSKPQIPSVSAKQKWSLPAKQPAITSEKPPVYKNIGQNPNNDTSCDTLPRQTRQKSDKSSSIYEIPDDLSGLSVSGVGECLIKLKMDSLVEFFHNNLIDGEMLLALDDETMTEMGIEKFHRLKLKKFINGWRPNF